jgi:hypothetical protein
MKTNFNINLEKYSTPTAFAIIITAAFLLAASFVVGWSVYYWYVVAYGFNHVISPIFNIPTISIWVAGGLSVLVGTFFSDIRHKLGKTTDASWTFLLTPFISHFLLWLLVG